MPKQELKLPKSMIEYNEKKAWNIFKNMLTIFYQNTLKRNSEVDKTICKTRMEISSAFRNPVQKQYWSFHRLM